MRRLLMALALVGAAGAQTITFSEQPFSRIPGLREVRVYVSDSKPTQVPGMRIVVEAMKQGYRVYSYPSLTAYVQDWNRRSWLRWVGIGLEISGWVITSAQASDVIKIRERWKAAIPAVTGAMTVARTYYDREYQPVEIPADMMQPLIAVPVGQAVEFSVFAQ